MVHALTVRKLGSNTETVLQHPQRRTDSSARDSRTSRIGAFRSDNRPGRSENIPCFQPTKVSTESGGQAALGTHGRKQSKNQLNGGPACLRRHARSQRLLPASPTNAFNEIVSPNSVQTSILISSRSLIVP